MGMEFTNGPMAVNSMVSGKITKCMAEDYLSGRMAVPMKANITMIKRKAMAFSCGQTIENTMATGKRASRKA